MTPQSTCAGKAWIQPDRSVIQRAGWPAVALLIAVKLLSGILERRHAEAVPGTIPCDARRAGRRGQRTPTAACQRRGQAGGSMTGRNSAWASHPSAVAAISPAAMPTLSDG